MNSLFFFFVLFAPCKHREERDSVREGGEIETHTHTHTHEQLVQHTSNTANKKNKEWSTFLFQATC